MRRGWRAAARRAACARWAEAALGRRGAGRETIGAARGRPARSRTLNRRYRGRDQRPTCCRSRRAALPAAPRLLGDLVICPQVLRARGARSRARACAAHWAHLFVHGLLHLAGLRPRARRGCAPHGAARNPRAARARHRQSLPEHDRWPKRSKTGEATGLARAHHARARRRPARARAAARTAARGAAARGASTPTRFAMLEGALAVAEHAGARHHGAARGDGVHPPRRPAGAHPAGGRRVRPFAFPGGRRRSRRCGRHPAGQGPAALRPPARRPRASTCANACGRRCSCPSPSG